MGGVWDELLAAVARRGPLPDLSELLVDGNLVVTYALYNELKRACDDDPWWGAPFSAVAALDPICVLVVHEGTPLYLADEIVFAVDDAVYAMNKDIPLKKRLLLRSGYERWLADVKQGNALA